MASLYETLTVQSYQLNKMYAEFTSKYQKMEGAVMFLIILLVFIVLLLVVYISENNKKSEDVKYLQKYQQSKIRLERESIEAHRAILREMEEYAAKSERPAIIKADELQRRSNKSMVEVRHNYQPKGDVVYCEQDDF